MQIKLFVVQYNVCTRTSSNSNNWVSTLHRRNVCLRCCSTHSDICIHMTLTFDLCDLET